MPVQIVEKRKTEPNAVSQHKVLVPLRVTSVELLRLRESDKDQEYVAVGDILIRMSCNWSSVPVIFNVTKSNMIDNRFVEAIRVVRAYNIQQIVICNDDEPAPIL